MSVPPGLARSVGFAAQRRTVAPGGMMTDGDYITGVVTGGILDPEGDPASRPPSPAPRHRRR